MKNKIAQVFLLSLITSPLTTSTIVNTGETNKILICQECMINTNDNQQNIPYEYKIENFVKSKKSKSQNNCKIIKHKKKYDGWAITTVNIRKKPNTNSKVLGKLSFNEHIKYIRRNDNWLEIKYNNQKAYVYKEYITNKRYKYIEYQVPTNSGFKSYMPYKAITNKSSNQYKLQNQYAYTGNYGIRQINGRYCVAIGTAFNAKIGDYADLILSNDEIIPIIISDIKDNKDTKSNNAVTSANGCVSEFIIDTNILNINVKKSGDVSSCKKEWNSKVVTIKIYNKNIFN